MPHLRLEVPVEWLHEEWVPRLLTHLVDTLCAFEMDDAARPGHRRTMINRMNLKHAVVPAYYAHVGGDPSKRFLHVTFACGNETPGRTAEVRSQAALTLGNAVDAFLARLPAIEPVVASVTVWVQDIDRTRGYTTTAERKKAREQQQQQQ
jgi:5-carboxymethyl-2-hydroxymuconate isomerase